MCLVVRKSVHRLAETLSFLIWEKAVARRLKRWTFVALLAAAACASPPEPSANDALTAAQPSAPAAPVVAAIPADRLTPAAVAAADDFLWLEEVSGTRATRWVNDQNKKTEAVFKADPRYDAFRVEALSILTAQDRIPAPSFRGEGIDNFWQDGKNVRGLWRATTLDSYTSDKPKWTTVLDIDALAKREGANWIYKGTECLAPDEMVCLVNLSDGGKDAVRVREFDTKKKAFVARGFDIPEGKHRIAWLDADTLLVATDFGAGSLTESGYPFIVKSLKRGQNLSEATEVYRGSAKDGGYGVDPMVMRDSAGAVLATLVSRPLDTYRAEVWDITGGRPVKLNLPERASIRGMLGKTGGAPPRLVFTTEENWSINDQQFAQGTLMAVGLRMLRPPPPGVGLVLTNGDLSVIAPTVRQSVEEVRVFDDRVIATVYDNVRGQAIVFTDKGEFGGWQQNPLKTPENVAIHLGSSAREAEQVFFTYEGFLTPSTLGLADIAALTSEKVKEAPKRFDASGHVVEQFEATSRDGTKVPYFVVRPKGELTGKTPTVMFGYGGFQVSYPPAYKPELGKIWLERGGAYVIANIRGGGEFGPAWHQAALKGNRQRSFDDFAAVAADLAARRITSATNLGIYGRSNGGVLTSVTMTQHPELIGGAVIESPLVDMMRYHLLPPGASWMGEYGDPRIADEARFIVAYSAYQNLKPDQKYPEVYITTNTRDDRVHPGHARKFAARLQAMGYPALYYENTQGGHSNDSDPVMNADRWARHYIYLARSLGMGGGE
jgi:prolyl oligopeptidase